MLNVMYVLPGNCPFFGQYGSFWATKVLIPKQTIFAKNQQRIGSSNGHDTLVLTLNNFSEKKKKNM